MGYFYTAVFCSMIGFVIGIWVSPHTHTGKETYNDGRSYGAREQHCFEMGATLSANGDCVVVKVVEKK